MRLFRGIPRCADVPVALTIGNFDGVHRGHQAMVGRLLAAARARKLPAAVMTFEPHPREFFSPADAPARLSPLREKLERLAELGVDRAYVCRFDASFATQSADAFVKDALARGLDVKWLLTGDDFRFGARRSGDVDLLRRLAPELGMEVESMHTVEVDGVRASSTAVREALAGGLLERAQRLLGRPYAITGRVVGGDRIGRELGFPTANIRMSLNRPPLWGIYAVTVRGLGTAPKIGAASLGVRPTVNSSGKATLEVFLLDFDGDIYGRRVRVEFLHKLRDEEKYPTLEALRNQIGLDVSATREFFRLRPPARAAV
ncbi:MAG: bifunctional riboflavin kinase/FAD synthetase [Betaproteobacteria bacterium]|nr:bifunctional riboflavin kinase/FAD synthetase [Betaproteobacteria bacterium]